MTRFARKQGLADKKEITRKAEEATSWENMLKNDEDKEDNKEFSESTKRKSADDIEEEKIRTHAEDYDKRIELENSNRLINSKTAAKKQKTSSDDFYYQKYADSIDKEVLNDLIAMKNKKKIVCFRCRKPGHSVNECEEMKKDNEHGTGICYKCGSTEHSVHK